MLSCITAWLRYYYTKEFFSACISIAEKDEDTYNYIHLLENEYNITTIIPDINCSNIYFKPIKDSNKILYGLGCIKGVGAKVLGDIVDNRPYDSLQNFLDKFTKSKINKKTAEALICAGAFDNLEHTTNRYSILNKFYRIRKQEENIIDENSWNENTCIEYELQKLNVSLTYKTWLEKLTQGDTVTFEYTISSKFEKLDKRNRLMAFVKGEANNCEIELVVFATKYVKSLDLFDPIFYKDKTLTIKAKKIDGNKFEFIKGSFNS